MVLYALESKADVIVWLVAVEPRWSGWVGLRPEHQRALDRLNEVFAGKIDFYGVDVSLPPVPLLADGSLGPQPLPVITVTVKPRSALPGPRWQSTKMGSLRPQPSNAPSSPTSSSTAPGSTCVPSAGKPGAPEVPVWILQNGATAYPAQARVRSARTHSTSSSGSPRRSLRGDGALTEDVQRLGKLGLAAAHPSLTQGSFVQRFSRSRCALGAGAKLGGRFDSSRPHGVEPDRLMKPRIFLGSSAQQEKLLQALTRGLQDIADVDAWTTVFNPGVSTLNRLVELTREVDFAAFVFAQDDWTTKGASPEAASGQASPRDNVVFEAGLFGGALGIRRTFILHANGAKLPTDLLGLTSIRYDPDTTPALVRQINQKLRKAIAAEGRISRLEGDWWQLSLTARTEFEPSAVSLLTISRDRAGALQVSGRSWQADGTLSARYWSEASKERVDPAGIFYFWKGERPRHPNAPQLEGTGEIKLESVDRAGGYWTTRSEGADAFHARTSGIYLRADPGDAAVLDGNDAAERAALIVRRLEEWNSLANS